MAVFNPHFLPVTHSFDTRICFPRALRLLGGHSGSLFNAYFHGHHELAFASDKFKNAFGRLFCNFADNVCPTVIDAVADRLQIQNFEVQQDLEEMLTASPAALPSVEERKRQDERHAAFSEAHERHVQAIWQENRMDVNAGCVHAEALVNGNGYVIVWPDTLTGRPRIVPQPASQVRVHYDEEIPGRVAWACKGWQMESGHFRLTLYFPDRIEKWITKSKVQQLPEKFSTFVPFDDSVRERLQLLPTGEPWPMPNPYGVVPVFHFANDAAVGQVGRSELRDVIPLQKALNKSVMDLMAAMEFVALPQRWAVGIDVEVDERSGQAQQPFVPGVDRLWLSPNADVKFGEFAQADLRPFVEVIDSFRLEIARVSGTPLHFFFLQGDPPSGEALKALEARLIKKVKDRQAAFGNVWEDVIRLAHVIAGHPLEVTFSTTWEDPAPRSEKEHAETLLMKKSLGVPRTQLLREFNYSEAQIQEFEAEREQEQANLAEQMLRATNRGDVGTDDDDNGRPGNGNL